MEKNLIKMSSHHSNTSSSDVSLNLRENICTLYEGEEAHEIRKCTAFSKNKSSLTQYDTDGMK